VTIAAITCSDGKARDPLAQNRLSKVLNVEDDEEKSRATIRDQEQEAKLPGKRIHVQPLIILCRMDPRSRNFLT